MEAAKTKRMRIVLCKGQIYGPISGSDETLVTYASSLHEEGHDVSVLLMYLHAEEDQYYQRLLEAEVPVSWIASNLTRTSVRTGRKLAYNLFTRLPASKKFIRRRSLGLVTTIARRHYRRCRLFFEVQKPDVIHVMTPDPSAMVMIRAAHETGIPVIYQELGIPYDPPDFACYYEQFTSVLSICSEIVALSPALLQHCRNKLPRQANLSILPIMAANDFDSQQQPPRKGNCKVAFGFAARMESLKGPLILLNAFKDAFRSCSNISLNVAGDGSQRKKMAAAAKTFGIASRYRYHGVYTHPKECRDFMEGIDVFVMPSLTEGTPNSIVEAMACGKPIIASSVGGIPDMIGHDAGILVAPGSVVELAQAIARLAKDEGLREEMGAAARRRYEQLFSPKAVLPAMLSTYARVLANGGRRDHNSRDDFVHPWLNTMAAESKYQQTPSTLPAPSLLTTTSFVETEWPT